MCCLLCLYKNLLSHYHQWRKDLHIAFVFAEYYCLKDQQLINRFLFQTKMYLRIV